MADQRISFEVWLENGQFKTAINDTNQSINSLAASTGSGANSFSSLTSAAKNFMAIGLVTAFASLAKSAVSAFAKIEQTQVALETMLGSSSKASKMIKEIQEYAAKTPFESAPLLENAKMMLNFGIAADQVVPSLKMLGEASAGNQEKMNAMVLAFSQIQSTGRLMGQDLLQLINAGFNPLQEISKKTGKSVSVLRDEMEKGKISASMVTQAFKDATSSGGRFFGLLERQSQTLGGLWSTLKDNMSMALQQMGEQMAPSLKSLAIAMSDSSQSGGVLNNVFLVMGQYLGSVIAKINTVVYGLKMVWAQLRQIAMEGALEGKYGELTAEQAIKANAELEKAKKDYAENSIVFKKSFNEAERGQLFKDVAYNEKKAAYERKVDPMKLGDTTKPGGLHGLSRDKFLSEFGKLGMTETEQAAFDQTKRQADLAKYEKHLKQLNISEAEYNKAKQAINDEYDQKVLESHAKAITRTGKLFDDMLKSAGSLVQTLGDNQVKAIEKVKELGDQLLDAQKDYLIASAGLAEETANQKIDKEIGVLEKKFNAEKNFAKRTEIEAELTAKRKEKKRLDIEKEYAEKKWLFDLMMDMRRRQKAAENFRLQQGIQIAQAVSSTALAATNVLASESKINFYYALAAMAAAIIAGGVQVGIIASQSPPMASGGFVPGSLPGSAKILAEGGRSEAVIPFENETYMSKFRSALGMDNQVVNTNIYLDGKLLGRQTDEYRRDRAYRQGVRDYSARSAY